MPPITPEQAQAADRSKPIPEDVFEVFNELIVDDLSADGRARVYRDDAVERLAAKGYRASDLFIEGWLDVEPHYRAAGWNVTYDQPAYNESYAAYYDFVKDTGVKAKATP